MYAPVVVIGAGQAGLAMSRLLSGAGIDHVVLERGDVAHSWRTERWDSLRLLTPNWMTRLPSWSYDGQDPDGFMTAAEFVGFLERYQRSFDPPVLARTTVERVSCGPGRFEIHTDRGPWAAAAVVAAAGACSEAALPAAAAELPAGIDQLTALDYRNPERLGEGDVLVVGASASGVQIADELARSGRNVTLAVGEHVRLPRTYRGRDIHGWLDALGVLDERYDEVDDLNRARRLPSLQLIGSPERRTLDLNALIDVGVRPVGKVMRVVGEVVQCSGGVGHLVANADLKHNRLLDRIDAYVEERGLDESLPAPSRPERTRLAAPPTELRLDAFRTVVWATGYRPRYPWLDPIAFDAQGRLRHDGGISPIPGLYFLGLPFLRRRKSNFIDGVGPDASEVLAALRTHLAGRGVHRSTEQCAAHPVDGLHQRS
ncbi:MAG: NAD(P)-binding domain-containing protein [Acidimicrobiales bacterium]